MSNAVSAAYIEGNYLGSGWSYRVNRLVKTGGRICYSALLTHEDGKTNSDKLYLWLAEFDTLAEARDAAKQMFMKWSTLSHPALK